MNSDWEQLSIAELSNNFDKNRIPVKGLDRSKGPYPYYGASGIVDWVDNFIFDGEYLLVAEDGENLRSRKTPIAFIAKGKFWVNNHAHILQGNEKSNTKFLCYALESKNISGYITGTTIPKLSRGNLDEILVSVPSMKEQKAIVDIIDTLDKKIELNKKFSETLEDLAKGLFKSWFIDFDPVIAKVEGRSTGLPDEINNLFPDSFIDSELGQIPKDWIIKNFGEICSNIYSGGTPNTKVATYWDDCIPWLSSGETRQNYVIDTDKKISLLGVKSSSTKLAVKGSTVIASAGQGHTRGQVSILLIDTYINQSLIAMNPESSQLSNYFLFFDCLRRYSEFRRVSDSSSSRGSLTTKILASLKVILPPIEFINHFDLFITPIIERIGIAQKETTNLIKIRDLLLPKLISGELRIPDAEKILEEIEI